MPPPRTVHADWLLGFLAGLLLIAIGIALLGLREAATWAALGTRLMNMLVNGTIGVAMLRARSTDCMTPKSRA